MGASLPLIQSQDQSIMLMQSRWKSQLDPVLTSLLLNGNLLRDISLDTGQNVINHLLGRQQIGWIMTDVTTGATFYRVGPFTTTTFTLNSSAPCIVSIWVF